MENTNTTIENEVENMLDTQSNLEMFLMDTDVMSKKTTDRDEVQDFIRKVGYSKEVLDMFNKSVMLDTTEQDKILTDMKKRIFYDTKSKMFLRIDVEDNKNEIKYYTKLDITRLIKDVYYPNSTQFIVLQGKKKPEIVQVCETSRALTFIMDENTIENINFKFDFFGENTAKKEKSNLVVYNNDITFNSLSNLSNKNKEDAQDVLLEYINFNPLFERFNKLIVASMFANDRKTSFFDLHFPANFGKSFMISIYKELGIAGEVEFEKMLSERSATSPEMVIGKMFIFEDEFKIFKADMKKITNEVSISAKNRLKTEVPVFGKVMLHAESVSGFNGYVDKQIQERITAYKLEDTGRLNDLKMFKKIGSGSYKTILKHFTLMSIKREIEMYKLLGKEESELEAVKFLKSEYDKNNLKSGNDLMTNLSAFMKDRLQSICIDMIDDEYNKKYTDFIYIKEMMSGEHKGKVEMFITRPKELFLKLIKESDDNNFKKTSIYKADKYEELMGGLNEKHKHPFYKTVKSCIRLDVEKDLDLVL